MICYRFADEAGRSCRAEDLTTVDSYTTQSLSAVTCRRCLEVVFRRVAERLALLGPKDILPLMLPDLQAMLAQAPAPPILLGDLEVQRRLWSDILDVLYGTKRPSAELWLAVHRAIVNAVVPG